MYLLAAVFGIACVAILRPLLSPILWAAVLAYGSWPLYRLIRKPFGSYRTAAALCMTVLLACAVVLPVIAAVFLIGAELTSYYQLLAAWLAQPPASLPQAVRSIPWLGGQLQQLFDSLTLDPGALTRQLGVWAQSWSAELAGLLGRVGRSVGEVVLVLFVVFFLYRDGERLAVQIRRVVHRSFGDHLDAYLQTAGSMTRAVLYGFLVTACAQGLIAGIGYLILGIRSAALLGALTGLLSAVPFLGTALVWGSVSAYLIATGSVLKGVLLIAWGFLLVHPTDNILRPLLISNATHVPLIVVMLGAIGGLAAWGLIGVVVGPVLLAIGVATWRQWVGEESA